MKRPFKVGDYVHYTYPQNSSIQDKGTITRITGNFMDCRIWVLWDSSGTEMLCFPENIRLVSKLEQVLK